MPRKPSITEGSPARISMNGLSTSRTERGATSAMKTAVARPSGTAISVAPRVTYREPSTSGARPKWSSIGYQRTFSRLSSGTRTSAGSPCSMRKMKIVRTKAIAEKPATRMKPVA
jgi:hypothetical protein